MKRKDNEVTQTIISNQENAWMTLRSQAVTITQVDAYDNITQHHILLSSKSSIRTLITLLQAALQEYED